MRLLLRQTNHHEPHQWHRELSAALALRLPQRPQRRRQRRALAPSQPVQAPLQHPQHWPAPAAAASPRASPLFAGYCCCRWPKYRRRRRHQQLWKQSLSQAAPRLERPKAAQPRIRCWPCPSARGRATARQRQPGYLEQQLVLALPQRLETRQAALAQSLRQRQQPQPAPQLHWKRHRRRQQ